MSRSKVNLVFVRITGSIRSAEEKLLLKSCGIIKAPYGRTPFSFDVSTIGLGRCKIILSFYANPGRTWLFLERKCWSPVWKYKLQNIIFFPTIAVCLIKNFFLQFLSVPRCLSAKSECWCKNPFLCMAFVRSSKTISPCLKMVLFRLELRGSNYKTRITYLSDPYMSHFQKKPKWKFHAKISENTSKLAEHKTAILCLPRPERLITHTHSFFLFVCFLRLLRLPRWDWFSTIVSISRCYILLR